MIPWKLDPPVFNGDPLHFPSFGKEAIMFADCCGFRDVFGGTREIPIADGDLSYTLIRARDIPVVL